MQLAKTLKIILLAFAVLSLSACATMSDDKSNVYNTANIMKKDKSQVALTLNKDLSVNVLGVRAGKKVKPCGKGSDCRYDKENVFAQKTFTITVVKGSCCAYISSGSSTYKFCTPTWPLVFVNSLSGEQCPE